MLWDTVICSCMILVLLSLIDKDYFLIVIQNPSDWEEHPYHLVAVFVIFYSKAKCLFCCLNWINKNILICTRSSKCTYVRVKPHIGTRLMLFWLTDCGGLTWSITQAPELIDTVCWSSFQLCFPCWMHMRSLLDPQSA